MIISFSYIVFFYSGIRITLVGGSNTKPLTLWAKEIDPSMCNYSITGAAVSGTVLVATNEMTVYNYYPSTAVYTTLYSATGECNKLQQVML